MLQKYYKEVKLCTLKKETPLTGKSRGSQGEVIKVLTADKRVVINGVNLITKHKKPSGREDLGGIVQREAPIDASNVMLICPECKKPSRTGKKEVMVDGKAVKVRVCKKCNADIFTKDDTR